MRYVQDIHESIDIPMHWKPSSEEDNYSEDLEDLLAIYYTSSQSHDSAGRHGWDIIEAYIQQYPDPAFYVIPHASGIIFGKLL